MEELKSQIKGFDINTPPPKDIIDLARAIRQQESSGGKVNVGDHGTSRGNFMFQKSTWEDYSKKVLGKVVPMTPITEKIVATGILYDRVYNKGYDIERAAASWNAPAPAASNNWQNWKGVSERNGKKIVYDTPGYVNKVMSHYNNFSKEPVPTAIQTPTEPKYGFNRETESQQLARLKTQKEDQDALSLQQREGREGIVDNVVGAAQDFTKGLGNSATRLGGNILTAGNEAIQKLGFKGSENPVLNRGTEANEFATGDATRGTNFIEKAGGFTGDLLPYLAPQLAATKVVGAAKALPLLQKLSGMGKATRGATKLGLLGAEGTLGGAATNIATEGTPGFDQSVTSLSNPFTQGALNVGLGGAANIISKLAGKKGSVLETLDNALKTGDEAQINAVMQSPEMKKFQFDKGITDTKSMGLAVQKEVNNVKDVLRQHRYANNSDKFKIVDNIDTDEVKAFLALQKPRVNDITGKPNFIDTLRNITTKQSEIGSQLEEVKTAIASIPSLKVNSATAAKDIAKIAQEILKDSKMLVEDKDIILDKMIKTLQAQTKGGVNFKTMDDLRIAGNAIEASDAYSAKSRQLLAQAVRKYTDNAIDELGNKGNLGLDEKNALKKFKELNKVWGDLEGAKKIAKLMSELPPQATGKLTSLAGGIIATGGSYNYPLFVGGVALTNSLRNLANKINTLSKYKAPATKMSAKAVKDTGNVIKQLTTLKLPKGTPNKQLPDPRSLREILLNQPK